MKPKIAIHDIDLLQQALLQLGVETQTKAAQTHNHAVLLHYFCNTNGSMRWVWPAGLTTPYFLRFYHSSHWRAKIFVWAVRLLFAFDAGRLLAHGTCLLFTNPHGQHVIRKIWKNHWSVFTGTQGPNRKMLHWHKSTLGAGIFTKIALTPTARQNLLNEQQSLQLVQQLPLKRVKTPQIALYQPRQLQLHEITGLPTHRIAQLPPQALQEWLQHSLQTLPLTQAGFWHTARNNRLQALPKCGRHLQLIALQKKLLQLSNHLQHTVSTIQTSGAHADFTPWNLRILNRQTIGLLDFELYQPQMPALYDLFHFIYQSVVLIEQGSYAHIQQQIYQLLRQPHWQQFMQQHRLNAAVLEQCYLLCNVSYYLNIYARQQTWHTQVNWLLQVWNDALSYHLQQATPTNARRLLLTDLPHLLNQYPHAVLKLRVNRLEELPENADLDVCLPYDAAKALLRGLKQHPAVTHIETRKFTFMFQAAVHLTGGAVLHLDLIWQFKRKQLQFLSASNVWRQAKPGAAGVNLPLPEHEFAYIWLFYHLNRAEVPAHYRQMLHKRIESSNSQQPCNRLAMQILQKETDYRRVPEELPGNTARLITANLLQQPPNKGYKGVLNRLAYGYDTLRQLLNGGGMVITFSGVDGAGKSTVIQQLKTRLEKEHRKRVVVLRHRPSLLPILSALKHGRQKAEQLAAGNLPRQGNNHNALSSALRFAYYYTDYLLGQFYVFVRYTLSGHIVLYDRYYFDFISDSRRSNIRLPQRLTAFLYRFLLKPKHNFFLYAPPECILQRKQELSAQTIEQLTATYTGLFNKLNKKYRQSHYIALQNINLPETLTEIINHINNHAHEKSFAKSSAVAQPAVCVSSVGKQHLAPTVCG
ncbi:hypothetical protein C7N43_24340 [Sphingobacteriales bacterium UPWRP_1]|nr:hypothetical protein BVG80_16680 [Sphingobacteriales bacterium TSM_CSM]PSJ74386.1 hypothetical protein C7N43_24340 [Sphingobacteriales bacterium UPWRP_1]